MAYGWKNKLTAAHVTPETKFWSRRQIMAGMAATGMAGGIAGSALAAEDALVPNSFEDISSYNNYYEFGTGKGDPAANAGSLTVDPWKITVGGLVNNPGIYSVAELLNGLDLEERIYRFRCVEAWAMVVPWSGVELRDILKQVGVQSDAKYVAFETLYRPEEMPGQRLPSIPWPYVEGLRLDEAMHPLTLMATGIYGKPIPNQNGAPIRLVVPWKYGFKSIKSIVKITLTDREPPTSWNTINAREYGFYSNVNPQVDHPRWSQASHRVIGGGLFQAREPTMMFNGYEEEVASLYSGMDLRKDF